MKEKQRQISVLLPEGHITYMTLVVNCLAQQKNIMIYVISNLRFSELSLSKKTSNFAYYPKTNNETDWIINIEKEIKKHTIDLIIPIDTYGIRTLIKNKNTISFSNKLGVLPTLENFNIADNKSLLARHMLKFNIAFPNTLYYTKEELLEDVIEDYPILIKPVEGFSDGEGILKFNGFQELKTHLMSKKLNYNFIIQNYISGYDIDCSVLCKNGEILAFTIQKGNLEGVREFAPNLGVEFLYNEELYLTVEKLMKSINWSGVAHIDMRYDQNDNTFKVIEINTRFSGSLDASLVSGVNFPYLYTLASLNLGFSKPKYNHVKYLNLMGLKKTIKSNILFLFNLKFIFNNTTVKFYIYDPLPLIYIMSNKIKSMLKKYNLKLNN